VRKTHELIRPVTKTPRQLGRAAIVSSEQLDVRTEPYKAEHIAAEFFVDQQEVRPDMALTAAGPVAG
jgi:hypothetical protein